jgi:colanic acid/amylovoran biosynthesis glycosyltransferase
VCFEGRARHVGTMLWWRAGGPVAAVLYRWASTCLGWWPLAPFGARPRSIAAEPRIAYYHHAFPVLSETFIQREVAALAAAGTAVVVFSHEPRGTEYFDARAMELMRATHYLALRNDQLPNYAWHFVRRHPWTLLNLFLYVVLRRHSARKSYRNDRQIFYRAIALAKALEEHGITHVHCPWLNDDALVALLAARLVKIPYTVQARASDIHRDTAIYGRREKLAHARFVVTNSRYNEAVLGSLLPHRHAPRVHVIYNGIDVQRFQPRRRATDTILRLLSVARLVEPKGLEYLVEACALLAATGMQLRCSIVGGRVASEVNYYITLQKLRRTLALDGVVSFAGAQPFSRVLEHYAEADIFILPAVVASDGRRDITPNALIEAMAMKLPVVSTTSGAIPEIVEDGVSGILVPPRNSAALAAAIARLAGDASLREELGANARRRVEERFDINKNIRHYVALFAGSRLQGWRATERTWTTNASGRCA